MSIFGKKSFRPEQELLPYHKGGVEQAETVLAAARRVHEQFGVKTEADKIANAIIVARNKSQAAEAFTAANIGILDIQQVVAHKANRIQSTRWERFKSWTWDSFGTILNFFEWHADKAGIATAVFFLPVGIPFLIDVFFYDVSYFWSFVTIFLSSLALLAIIEEFEDVFDAIGVAILTGLAWIPVTLFGFWFYHIESDREWKLIQLSDYEGSLSMSATLKIDQVISVLPDAKLELEVLESNAGEDGELFITLSLGNNGDRLYLWHEAA